MILSGENKTNEKEKKNGVLVYQKRPHQKVLNNKMLYPNLMLHGFDLSGGSLAERLPSGPPRLTIGTQRGFKAPCHTYPPHVLADLLFVVPIWSLSLSCRAPWSNWFLPENVREPKAVDRQDCLGP
jgi:hypothetical protein